MGIHNDGGPALVGGFDNNAGIRRELMEGGFLAGREVGSRVGDGISVYVIRASDWGRQDFIRRVLKIYDGLEGCIGDFIYWGCPFTGGMEEIIKILGVVIVGDIPEEVFDVQFADKCRK